MHNKIIRSLGAGLLLLLAAAAHAVDYKIDTKGAHAFIQFHIKHLGYSWLVGRFNTFSGDFSYDERDPGSARVAVTIDTASIDRGKSKDFAAHVNLMTNNIPAFENLANLDKLPATGVHVVALPVKIRGGSGGPLRIVARVPTPP